MDTIIKYHMDLQHVTKIVQFYFYC